MLMGRFSRGLESRRGAVLVEFAIVVMLLFTLIFGIIDFGLLLKDYIALNQVAREAARKVAVGDTPNVAALATKVGIDGTISSTIDPGEAAGDDVTVTLIYDHPLLTGLFGQSKELTATMVMRRE